MTDDILKFLDEVLNGDDEGELTDVEAEALLSQPIECSDESFQNMRILLAEKMIRAVTSTPITQVGETPFGRWIETARKRAGVSIELLQASIGTKGPFVERLESGALLPWQLTSAEATKLVRLFRIHMTALRQMVSASFNVSQTRLTGNVRARSHGGKTSIERGDATKRALDLFLARNAKKADLSPEIEKWLQAIQTCLEADASTDLL